jgi:ADP-ribose pyrophosphatase YjhB (NUDIX family)
MCKITLFLSDPHSSTALRSAQNAGVHFKKYIDMVCHPPAPRKLTRVLICHFAHLRLYLQQSSTREPRMFTQHSHCSYCGHPFEIDQAWPRLCAICGNISFVNPLPVSVVLLPVDDGLLVVRRNIEPQIGQLALPGGYINRGESWQQAGARELLEETGIALQPESLREFCVKSAPGYNTLLVFAVAPAMPAQNLPSFTPNEETQEICVLTAPQELAFSTHTEALREYFAGRQVNK